jgi:hypothetical protein
MLRGGQDCPAAAEPERDRVADAFRDVARLLRWTSDRRELVEAFASLAPFPIHAPCEKK